MTSWLKYSIWAVVLGLVALFVVPLFVPWTPLNCQIKEIDIRTGRVRSTSYLGFCKVSERITDSTFSKLLPADFVSKASPDWRKVNTFSPGVHHSPHHSFHGAFGQIRMLELAWENGDFDSTIKRKTVQHVLDLWQFGNSYFAADRYIDSLVDGADDKLIERVKQNIGKVEMPRVQVEGDSAVLTLYYPDGGLMERFQGRLDSKGEFINDGVWETWRVDGKRQLYGHFQNGEHHGRRFEWDSEGKLIVIEAFDHGSLSEYEGENLERHPDYEVARKLAGEPRPVLLFPEKEKHP